MTLVEIVTAASMAATESVALRDVVLLLRLLVSLTRESHTEFDAFSREALPAARHHSPAIRADLPKRLEGFAHPNGDFFNALPAPTTEHYIGPAHLDTHHVRGGKTRSVIAGLVPAISIRMAQRQIIGMAGLDPIGGKIKLASRNRA